MSGWDSEKIRDTGSTALREDRAAEINETRSRGQKRRMGREAGDERGL